MTFLWHEAFALFLVVPLLIGTYVALLGRKKKDALRYSSLTLVHDGMGSLQHIRRHLPPLLFLLALMALVVAIARPATIITAPTGQRTIVLAMDVSWSMAATDVGPSRLAAAQDAARRFVKALPRDARVGILAFAGSADLVQPPTAQHLDALAAIDALTLASGTALGSALIAALLTIFPNADIAGGYDIWGTGRTPDGPPSFSLDAPRKVEKQHFQAVPPGSCTWAAIVLLTDGRTNMGPDPLRAARMAADLGVRVFTVGFGAPESAQDGRDTNAENSRLDETTLSEIAFLSRGEYVRAANADELRQTYRNLSGRITLEKAQTELTAVFSAIASLLMLASAGLSLFWNNRLV